MYRCFETILSKKGELQHLKYHQNRLNLTQEKLFGTSSKIELKDIINPPKNIDCRVKVLYDKELIKVEYISIKKRDFKRFKLIQSDLEYPFKFQKRDSLDSLKVDGFDDVIIHKEGLLRDTTIANIALLIDDIWLTPKNALLRGTTRQRLLESGFLKEEVLFVKDLEKASNFAIMNAVIGFYVIGGDFCVT